MDEHLSCVLQATFALGEEKLEIAAAHGRVLAEDVFARVSVPVFDNSAMDGYAVRYDDVAKATESAPARLAVVADLAAGTSECPLVAAGQAARIMTGAPFPPGADTVVPVEDTDGSTTTVAVFHAKERGSHVRFAGEDVEVGDLIVGKGTRLGALEISAIASAGVGRVVVHQQPRVAVLSTGSELVPPGEPLDHGQIPESNSLLIANLASEAGAKVVHRGTTGDEVSDLLAAVDELSEIDVLILTGGVSVGAYDVVRAAFAERGEIEFVPVAMQPGKPQGFGRFTNGPLVFCLPGNPVSAAVSFETFVRPAFAKQQGLADKPAEIALAAENWRARAGRLQVVPVTLTTGHDGQTLVRPVNARRGSGSHRSATLARADGWAIIPTDIAEVRAGDRLEVWRR